MSALRTRILHERHHSLAVDRSPDEQEELYFNPVHPRSSLLGSFARLPALHCDMARTADSAVQCTRGARVVRMQGDGR
jgi:hypothetical protein